MKAMLLPDTFTPRGPKSLIHFLSACEVRSVSELTHMATDGTWATSKVRANVVSKAGPRLVPSERSDLRPTSPQSLWVWIDSFDALQKVSFDQRTREAVADEMGYARPSIDRRIKEPLAHARNELERINHERRRIDEGDLVPMMG